MFHNLYCFYAENGLMISMQAMVSKMSRFVYNRMISNKLMGARNLNIHPSAYIKGLSHINIGNSFSTGRHLWLEAVTFHHGEPYIPSITIGNDVCVSDSVHIAATNCIIIGNNVLIASKVYISDHSHGAYKGKEQSSPEVPPNRRRISSLNQVIIEDNVWIGESVSVLPNVTIGKGSVIGSNSVVTKNIPPYSIAIGVPARVYATYNHSSNIWERL